ncbi:anaphase-promoting complex subunit 15-like [Amphibalanus amphitrite]|nr:anaphase-promoting complex subunit 15-like isoform X3 [Amphibalanus amphitrite]XP_043190097.1 anaphase-promoting complex subunit 15-like isoform X3 [Amphibalanus amphitrite]XP_043242367.1 anaphase-promoting complex subunit 15-like [Amphibalanus amphitrite]XP_043242369.1 anaphase-promoting complex subunit 15-like [Amphibalanus amphitrite]
MNFQQSPFPKLDPVVSCSSWSRLDRRTDAEQELRLQEQEQLELLTRLRQQGSDALPLGRSTVDGADEEDEAEEDEYDDDDNDDEEEDDSEMAEDLDPPIDQRF